MTTIFEYIINPETGKRISIYGNSGKKVLNKYITQLGGAIRNRSIIPSDQFLQAGGDIIQKGGACSVCGKKGHNKRTCSSNLSDKADVKKMLKYGKTVHPNKLKQVSVKVPKTTNKSMGKIKKKPEPKKTTTRLPVTKKPNKSSRLSAGQYYRDCGTDSEPKRCLNKVLGDRCNIRKDGEYKCLLKNTNDIVRWAKKSKSGVGQEICGDWSVKCKDPEYQ
jgi:hypothetical protein